MNKNLRRLRLSKKVAKRRNIRRKIQKTVYTLSLIGTLRDQKSSELVEVSLDLRNIELPWIQS